MNVTSVLCFVGNGLAPKLGWTTEKSDLNFQGVAEGKQGFLLPLLSSD